MSGSGKIKNCTNYKSMEQGLGGGIYRNIHNGSCKDCAYFSSRNCGMDAADSIVPDLEIFY